MPETLFHPENYEQFTAPETGEDLNNQLERNRKLLDESFRDIVEIQDTFKEQSKIGAHLAKIMLGAMGTSMRGKDYSFCESVKTRVINFLGEAAWVGFLGEFTAARLLLESGGAVYLPGNIPDELPKPSGYDPRTGVEQDRLESIDLWLQYHEKYYALTIKTVGLSPSGQGENQIIYSLNVQTDEIKTELGEIFTDENTTYGVNAQRRYEAVMDSARTVKAAAARYGVEPLLILLPVAGVDKDINGTTGEPDKELVEFFNDRLLEITEENEERTH